MRNKKWMLMYGVILAGIISRCALMDAIFPPKEPVVLKTPSPESDANEDIRAQGQIKKFLDAVYREPVEMSYMYSVKGEVPPDMQAMLDEDTLKKTLNTTELPVHYPRFVDINGLTAVGYETATINKQKEVSVKLFDFTDQSYSYLVEVGLKAAVVKADDFAKYYRYNPTTKFIDKIVPQFKDTDLDYIKLKAKYEVNMKKLTNADYKIVSFLESAYKRNTFRLNRANNEFITRTPFFDLRDNDEKQVFTEESNYVKTYIEKMITAFDEAQMPMVGEKWSKNGADFADLLDGFGLLKDAAGKVYLKDIYNKQTYQQRFSLDIFPYKAGIGKILKIKSTVKEYPSTTQKNRNYAVNVQATVERSEGKALAPVNYTFEYIVNLDNPNMEINFIKLSQFYLNR